MRKQSFGVGVERTFPLHSPKIEKIEVAAIGDVNRAKLYYLRGKVGKKARVRELRQDASAREPLGRRAGSRSERGFRAGDPGSGRRSDRVGSYPRRPWRSAPARSF